MYFPGILPTQFEGLKWPERRGVAFGSPLVREPHLPRASLLYATPDASIVADTIAWFHVSVIDGGCDGGLYFTHGKILPQTKLPWRAVIRQESPYVKMTDKMLTGGAQVLGMSA